MVSSLSLLSTELFFSLLPSWQMDPLVKRSFKSEEAGLSRAKAGVMRRLSMVALRATARQVLRGLAIVGPPCIHQHNAREAARRAHLDAFGADRGAPWRNPTNGGG